MNAVTQVFAVVAALVFVWAGLFESFFFHRPGVHVGIFHTRSEDVPAIRLWSFCQGFYNLFLAAGAIGGVIALHTGNSAAGRALVLYACAFMFGTGIVLAIADRRHLDGAVGAVGAAPHRSGGSHGLTHRAALAQPVVFLHKAAHGGSDWWSDGRWEQRCERLSVIDCMYVAMSSESATRPR